jgi:hypothetical protein
MMTLTIHGRLTCDVADLIAASAAYAQARELSGKGASQFPEGKITEGGQLIARVSYNGRVWAVDPAKPAGGGNLVYCPGSVGKDEGRPDIFNEGREACWGRRVPNPYPADSIEHEVFNRGFDYARSCYANPAAAPSR